MIGLFAPGGIIFFLFPPLIVLAGTAATRWWRPAERTASLVAIAFLYLTWGAMLGLLQDLLNTGPMWIFALLGSLLVLPVLIEARPLIASAGRRLSTSGRRPHLARYRCRTAAPAYSADRQQRFVIQQVTQFPGGKSWWSILQRRGALPKAMPGPWKRGTLPISERQRWLSDAPTDARSASTRRSVAVAKSSRQRTCADAEAHRQWE